MYYEHYSFYEPAWDFGYFLTRNYGPDIDPKDMHIYSQAKIAPARIESRRFINRYMDSRSGRKGIKRLRKEGRG